MFHIDTLDRNALSCYYSGVTPTLTSKWTPTMYFILYIIIFALLWSYVIGRLERLDWKHHELDFVATGIIVVGGIQLVLGVISLIDGAPFGLLLAGSLPICAFLVVWGLWKAMIKLYRFGRGK